MAFAGQKKDPVWTIGISRLPFLLYVDASEVRFGAVLLEDYEGRDYLVIFLIQKLHQRLEKYATI